MVRRDAALDPRGHGIRAARRGLRRWRRRPRDHGRGERPSRAGTRCRAAGRRAGTTTGAAGPPTADGTGRSPTGRGPFRRGDDLRSPRRPVRGDETVSAPTGRPATPLVTISLRGHPLLPPAPVRLPI